MLASALMLSLGLLWLTGGVASAASDLPSTITIEPASADSGGSTPIIAEPVAPPTDVAPETTTPQGNSASDIIVMLIIAFLIAAVGGALTYAWYQTHGALRQPGMGAGDDPIWSNAGDEPIWSAATLDTSS
jgi:hypothetical protein